MTKLKSVENLTPNEIMVLAAWFAISNIGQPRPSRQEVTQALARNNVSLDGVVIAFGRQYIESDHDLHMFVDEADGWMKDISIKYKTRASVLKIWPYVEEYFWPRQLSDN